MQSKNNPQRPKHELTLKEKMAMQGKLSKKTPPEQDKPQQKAIPQRTEAEKKRQAAQLAETISRQMGAKPAGKSKEDKLREMIGNDPEKAAEILRGLIKGK